MYTSVLLIAGLGYAQAEESTPKGVTGLKLKAGKGRVLLVTSVLKGTPAELVGIKKGDKIVAISDKSLQKMKLSTAVKMLRGAPGTKLHLTIKRGSADPFDIILRRAEPKPKLQAKTSSVATTTVSSTVAK